MTLVLIVSSTIAIVFSFLCSLAEALLLGLNPLTLTRLQGVRPRAAQSWRRLKRNVARPITAILVLNTVAHTGGATVAGGAFAEIYGEQSIWIFSVAFTIIVLFGTEILPKIIGVTFGRQLAPTVGPILEALTVSLSPLIRLSELMFSRLTSKKGSQQITAADLVTLATLARSGKAINLEQENIIVNAVRLSHTPIVHAMIPTEKIRFIRRHDEAQSILAMVRESGHSRYPVSSSSKVEDIFAYVVAKKVIPDTDDDIVKLVADAKPIHTVDQRDTLMTALQCMLRNREHLLAVVDGKRRCIGIVTLEDIAGELLNAEIEGFR
ncbi:MAG: DUF21 domain-containing protein [Planctomycetes bacterium]|nr:DUF21 domain-containing protein [Planctomycetota bacterium]